jgi:hypothetical protein
MYHGSKYVLGIVLRGMSQQSKWMQDGCKVYMDSYMASNGSCVMVTWIIFKNHLLEVGLTQKRKTMAFQTLTTVDLFGFYHVWGPAWLEIHCNSIWLGTGHIWLHTALEDPWPSYMILEVSCNGLWTLSFGLSQFHGHGSWLACEVTLNMSISLLNHVQSMYPSQHWVFEQTFACIMWY